MTERKSDSESKDFDPLTKIWSIDEIQLVALSIGKSFKPAEDIKDRLEEDLSKGALVLFNEQGVLRAAQEGFIPKPWERDLINLVNKLNDIAVIPADALLKPRVPRGLSRELGESFIRQTAPPVEDK